MMNKGVVQPTSVQGHGKYYHFWENGLNVFMLSSLHTTTYTCTIHSTTLSLTSGIIYLVQQKRQLHAQCPNFVATSKKLNSRDVVVLNVCNT